MDKVFHIVNEQTRTPAKNPVLRALPAAGRHLKRNDGLSSANSYRLSPLDHTQNTVAVELRYRSQQLPKSCRVRSFKACRAATTRRVNAKHLRLPGVGYLVAIAATALVATGRVTLWPVLGEDYPLLPFVVSVAAGAWYGGLKPGLLATALSSLIAMYLFLEPTHDLAVAGVSDRIGLAIFIGSGVLISWLIEALHRARRLADERREVFRVTLSSIGDAVMTTDVEGRVTSLNPVAESLTGWTEREGVIVGLANHTALVARDGAEHSIDDSAAPIRDRQGKILGVVLVFRDMTERRRTQERMQHLAYHDGLTGLPNRVLLQDRLERLMAEADRDGDLLALLYLDLDRFKTINDSLGHDIGDQLLVQVADRLNGCVRQADTLSRVGGDEFLIVLKGMRHAEDAARVAQKILTSLAHPITVGSNVLDTSCSVGISLYPIDGQDTQTLMRNADMAMYHAKEKGRRNYQFFSEDMNTRAVQRMKLENALRRALDRNEFVLHYQPMVNLTSGRIAGVEALIRWQHPHMGLIWPAKFISLAEETGMIMPIGQWVLENACKQMRAWLDAGLPPMRVAINLSAPQFNQIDLAQRIAESLSDARLHASRLQLEVTEGMAMQDPESNGRVLNELKSMGIILIIDDFGTGYSCLNYLKRLPISGLKIDRSFVDGVPTDVNDVAITRATIAMAQSLNLQVTAEGVETETQRDFLGEAGCHEFQGYLFSKPCPAQDIETMLQQHRYQMH
jgi:diguanylate cyclase (GGDEF)-like protein